VVGVFIVGFLIVAAYVIYWVLPEPKQKQVRQQIKQAKQKLKGLLHRHD
jgi:beta-lactam-binding protein with PASTA domain